jgi:hypothetical protein
MKLTKKQKQETIGFTSNSGAYVFEYNYQHITKDKLLRNKQRL